MWNLKSSLSIVGDIGGCWNTFNTKRNPLFKLRKRVRKGILRCYREVKGKVGPIGFVERAEFDPTLFPGSTSKSG
jgi:hypothetical protein